MTANEFSDSELLILGLISEMPRHGYELEQVIEKRVMREWTRIGFSSIYYVLGKLEKKGLVQSDQPESVKAKKRYTLTEAGQKVLIDQTLAALANVQPTYPSLLLGLINLSALSREQVLEALKTRKESVAAEMRRIKDIHFDQQPLPDHIDAIFEYSIGQLTAESYWINRTYNYLETKAWLD
jgi:DNA-binding PadR family transcriptional regulator